MPTLTDQEFAELEARLVALPLEIAERVRPIIKRAVQHEREACAKIAEAAPVYGNRQIAAMIRERKD